MKKGDFCIKGDCIFKDEIGSLGHAINRMGSGLQKRASRKHFEDTLINKLRNEFLMVVKRSFGLRAECKLLCFLLIFGATQLFRKPLLKRSFGFEISFERWLNCSRTGRCG